MRRFLSSVITAAVVLTPLALLAEPASAAKAGQLCKAADVGKSQDGLKCAKDGTRFRWEAGGATTRAPTTKAAATTKKSSPAKSSSTTKKSTASAGGGTAVNGRFCAAAEKGRRATDAKGQKLTCKADSSGKNRWQA